MIAGSAAGTAHFSREAVAAATGPAERRTTDGATHVDLYEHVTTAVAEPTRFFAAHPTAAW